MSLSTIPLPLERVVSTDRRFLSRPMATESMLALLGIDKRYQEFVRVLDQQENLALVHYLTTFEKTSPQVDEQLLQEFGHARGTIIDVNSNRVVCRSYPYTPEKVVTDEKPVGKAFQACEGTVLRLFYYGEKWHLSTHRKIDASNSYWSGPTFGELFQKTRKFSNDELNKDFCYVFLLSHDDNRLVYEVPEPQLLVITVYDQKQQTFLCPDKYKLPTGTVAPKELSNEELSDYKNFVNTAQRFDCCGVLFISDPTNPKPVKVINQEYYRLKNARGNEPSLRTRYLQLRGTEDGRLLVNWYTEPRYNQFFDAAERELDELIRSLHAMYLHRYVSKNYNDLPKEEFITIQRCHNWHKMDRKRNIVTEQKVREMVNQTLPHYVLTMVRRLRMSKRKAEEYKPEKSEAEPVFD